MKKMYSLPLIGALLLLSSALFAASPHFTIIIDAGSTGSRLHLFQHEAAGQQVPLIRDIFSESIKPGLSSFASNPKAAGKSLKKLLDDALQELQKNKIDPRHVNLHILATAGMRLLPTDTQTAIYKSVTYYIRTHYPLSLGEIKTIAGKMEGLYGWLDINYLLKSFDSKKDITKGSIDMGGASTQIAFSTQDNSKAADEITLIIGENTYTVFSKSFLGLGMVQALADLNNYPLAFSCYPRAYPLSTETEGNFNFSTCSSLYQDLINKYQVAQQVLPTADNKFIAYSGAYYTYNFFGVVQTTNQEIVEKQIQSVCGETWDQLLHEYANVPEKYLSSFCAHGVYLSNLLYDIYQIPGKNFMVAAQINQQEIDWTLGALLYELVHAKNTPS